MSELSELDAKLKTLRQVDQEFFAEAFTNPVTRQVTLYDELKAAGVEIGNHESDLYFPVSDVAIAILNKPEHQNHRKIATTFLSNVTHTLWFDVPFAFEPWWEQRISSDSGRAELRAERISYGELAEMQSLAPYIEPGDVEERVKQCAYALAMAKVKNQS